MSPGVGAKGRDRSRPAGDGVAAATRSRSAPRGPDPRGAPGWRSTINCNSASAAWIVAREQFFSAASPASAVAGLKDAEPIVAASGHRGFELFVADRPASWFRALFGASSLIFFSSFWITSALFLAARSSGESARLQVVDLFFDRRTRLAVAFAFSNFSCSDSHPATATHKGTTAKTRTRRVSLGL